MCEGPRTSSQADTLEKCVCVRRVKCEADESRHNNGRGGRGENGGAVMEG